MSPEGGREVPEGSGPGGPGPSSGASLPSGMLESADPRLRGPGGASRDAAGGNTSPRREGPTRRAPDTHSY